MLNKKAVLLCVKMWMMALVLCSFSGMANAATNSWVSPVSGLWSNGSNWSLRRAPISTDTVYITVEGTADYIVTMDVSPTVYGLTIGARSGLTRQSLLINTGKTLNATAGLVVYKKGRIYLRGVLTGADASIYGTLVWQAGTMSGKSTTTIQSGGLFDFSTTAISSSRSLLRNLVNNGRVNWGAATLTLTMSGAESASFVNGPAGIFNILGAGTVGWNGEGTQPVFSNNGLIVKSGATGGVRFDRVRYDSSGTTDIQSGSFELRGGARTIRTATTTAPPVSYKISAGARVDFSNDVSFDSPANITGDGKAHFSSGIMTINQEVVADNLDVSSGNISGASALRIMKQFDWFSGTMEGAGQTVIEPGATLNISGVGTKAVQGRTVENKGTAVWTGTGGLTMAGNFTNRSGALFDVQNDVVLSGKGVNGTGTFLNLGTLRKSQGTGQTVLENLTIQNEGLLQAQTGVLNLGAAYSQSAGSTVLAGGSLAAIDVAGARQTLSFRGGTVNGTGQIDGHVYNGARVQPGNSPGAIEILGNYTQAANGVLDIEIAGVSPGAQYDHINVGGMATLAGTVNALRLNGYVPPDNTTFEVISAVAGVTGSFSSTVGMGIGGGRYFTPVYAGDFFGLGTALDAVLPTAIVSSPLAGKTYPSLSYGQLTT
ncbi:MAG TPA: hypothetical protein VF719_07955, partial [Abditibacteriaceae bacterium]